MKPSPPSDHWHRLKGVFSAVAEVPTSERAALLDAACGDDAALRAEVEALLAAHDRPTGVFERLSFAPVGALGDDAPLPSVAQQVGPYRLLREVGRGGMGAVYQAARADGQYAQHVALKLLRPGRASADALARFRAERQILARLDHPHIARLLDGGTADPLPGMPEGPPYLVLEYVEGLPLDAYCDAHRLGLDARLDLFRTVCDAVAYAHQNLVVHRDLKPSNILVNTRGEVKLLDFGIAKLLEDTPTAAPRTQTGFFVMTPDYAAPEQLRGAPITTATDQYALGVLLYELLTGTRPYPADGTAPADLARLICDVEPPRPSTALVQAADAAQHAADRALTPERLRRRLRGDLDTIILKALRKEPGRRYGSVAAFAEDLRRHQAHLPVVARADTIGYRVNRFVRRHRVGVAAALLAALALVTALGVALWQGHAAQTARLRAEAEATKAARINRFLQDMLASADPRNVGRRLTVQEVLDQAAARIATELRDDPETEAAIRETIALSYQGLGLHDQARPHFEAAYALQRRLHGPRDHADVAEALKNLALQTHYEYDLLRADSLYAAAVARYRRLDPPDPLGLAQALNDWSTLRHDQGRYAEAETLVREALALFAIVGDTTTELAATYNNLALYLDEQGQTTEAEAVYRRAVSVYHVLNQDDHLEALSTLNNLAFVLHGRGATDSAAVLFQQVFDRRAAVLGSRHPQTVLSETNLAVITYLAGDLPRADTLLQTAVATARAAFDTPHPYLSNALFWQGRVAAERGRPAEGVAAYREARTLRQHIFGPDHPTVLDVEERLGDLLLELRRPAEARPLLRHRYDLLRRTPDADSAAVAEARAALLRAGG